MKQTVPSQGVFLQLMALIQALQAFIPSSMMSLMQLGNAATTVVRTVTVDSWDFNDSDTHAWTGTNDVDVTGGDTYATLTLGSDTNSMERVKVPQF